MLVGFGVHDGDYLLIVLSVRGSARDLLYDVQLGGSALRQRVLQRERAKGVEVDDRSREDSGRQNHADEDVRD